MAWPMLLERRRRSPAPVAGLAAAGSEAAPCRKMRKRWDHALDLVEAQARSGFAGLVEVRDGLQQTARVGVGRALEQSLDVGFLNLPARIHDDHAVGIFRHRSEEHTS